MRCSPSSPGSENQVKLRYICTLLLHLAAQLVWAVDQSAGAGSKFIQADESPTTTEDRQWRHAEKWILNPKSFCYPGPIESEDYELTILSVAFGMATPVLSCIKLNRLLMALDQKARYCHMYSMDPTRSTHWAKVLAMKQTLYWSRYVLWVDSDALFARFDVPLLQFFLGFSQGKDAVFSSAFRGLPDPATDEVLDSMQDTIRLNTGVIFLRSSVWTLRFLNAVYANASLASWWGDPFHDQSGFARFQRRNTEEWKAHVRVVHYRYFNGWERTFAPDSLVHHAAGGAGRAGKYDRNVYPKCMKFNCLLEKVPNGFAGLMCP